MSVLEYIDHAIQSWQLSGHSRGLNMKCADIHPLVHTHRHVLGDEYHEQFKSLNQVTVEGQILWHPIYLNTDFGSTPGLHALWAFEEEEISVNNNDLGNVTKIFEE
jgi:hypothetical protein